MVTNLSLFTYNLCINFIYEENKIQAGEKALIQITSANHLDIIS